MKNQTIPVNVFLGFLWAFSICGFNPHPLATRGQGKKKKENFCTIFDLKFEKWGRREQTAWKQVVYQLSLLLYNNSSG